VLESANRENTATHWQNNTLSTVFVPHENSTAPKLRPVTPDSDLFPTLGTNYPRLAIAGTMGSRNA
jgi:hypothetical protein